MSAPPPTVFISSVQGDDFDGIRASAAEAAQRLGFVGRMAEETPGGSGSSRAVIEREIRESDVVMTLVGARAGTMLDEDISIVEDEYRMAKSMGRPVIVLLQEIGGFEPEQDAFVERLRGDWEDGQWAPRRFTGSGDVGLDAVVPALWRHVRGDGSGDEALGALAREALETFLDAADRANQRIVGKIVDEIETRRRRTDDISFRTMFDLLCETPEWFGDLGDVVSTETERIGLVVTSGAGLLRNDAFAREHLGAVLETQTILREFRRRTGQAGFIASAAELTPGAASSLRAALDFMHDGLFARQRLLAGVRLDIDALELTGNGGPPAL